MQQNATGPGHPARVQFPEQLAAAEIPRPPSTRPLPRVGSHNKDPSIPRSPNHANDGYERNASSSAGSSLRAEGIGLGRPSRSPAHVPSPLNPTARRSSGQHVHRKRDSSDTFDASKYDFDNAFDQAEVGEDAQTVAPDHAEALARLAQLQKKRTRAESQRNTRQEEGQASRIQMYAENFASARRDHSRSPKPASRPVAPLSLASSATFKDSSAVSTGTPATQTVRSSTPSSQSQGSIRGQESDELWTSVFQKGRRSKEKARDLLTEDQYNDMDQERKERLSQIREKASPASLERATATADQLRRRYDLFFPSLKPTEKPFNLMNVMRWRREMFDANITSLSPGPFSQEEEAERKSLSWRPHLADLHDPQSSRYRSRIYAPWHLTALLMEQSLQSLKRTLTASPLSGNSPNRPLSDHSSNPPLSSHSLNYPPAVTSQTELHLHSEPMQPGDTSAENDSNQSAAEPFSRGLSLRRFKKSLPGTSKSVDLGSGRSPHQSRTSISSLNIFGHGSPSNSRAHINKLLSTFAPPKPVGEHSDNEQLSGSANEKEGYDSSGRRRIGGDPERLAIPLSEEDFSQRSSDDAKTGSPVKRRRPRNFFTRDDTIIPIGARKRAGSIPIHLALQEEKTERLAMDMITPRPDTNKRFRLNQALSGRVYTSSQEDEEERRRSFEEKQLDLAYEQREEECHGLDEIIRNMNEEQYQLLQLGREYLEQASELKEQFHLDKFPLLTDDDFRDLTDPTSRSLVRREALAREPHFIEKQAQSERQAELLRKAILDGHFAPPLVPDLYFNGGENLDVEFRKLAAIGRDLDYVARVASDHTEKSKRIERVLKSLRDALREANTHDSQVFVELTALETLVAASRPVPTWKRISNNVKPLLSWGLTVLTWVLKFLGEVGRIIGFFIPPFLKKQFHWEMLSGSWPTFVWATHYIVIHILRRNLGLYWSFETGVVGAVAFFMLAYPFYYGVYLLAAVYNRLFRLFVLSEWWEKEITSRSLSRTQLVRRHWEALALLLLPICIASGLSYWLLRTYL